MYRTPHQPEHHPWLKLFTIMAIPAGALYLLLAFSAFNDPMGDNAMAGLALLLIGGGTIAASIYTLQVTNYFRRWAQGVPKRNKAIAVLPIYMGINMCLALILFVPFMRFVTDSVGGGLGIRSRT